METAIWVALISSVGALVLGIYNSIPAFRRSRLDQQEFGMESIRKLSEQVDGLIEDKIKMNERINWLEGELKRYTNGYSRAMRFINIHGDPRVTVPDFLESDPAMKPRAKR